MSHIEVYDDDDELADFIASDDGTGPNPYRGQAPHGSHQSDEADESADESAQKPASIPESSALEKLKHLGATLTQNVPEQARILRAHIAILVSALGGPDHTASTPVYKLGHDAMACLKDIKRWLRAVDEKNATYEVALACADCDLVRSDLTVILCQWDKPRADVPRPRNIEKVSLACLELLVLLTWPTDINRDTLMKDYTAKTSTRRAQLAYKHHILTYKDGKTLKSVVRLGLAALKAPAEQREPRDLNILRLILFFIRNVLYIEPLLASKGPRAVTNASLLPQGLTADEVALPAVLSAFEYNNVLLFLTSIAHVVHTEIRDEAFGLLVMECISLLTKGVATQELVARKKAYPDAARTVPPASSVAGMDLQDLLGEEDRRRKHANSHLSTRHGRFGTLLSIRNTDNAAYFAVSGQKGLASTYDSLEKLDASKTWHRPVKFKHDANAYAKRPTVVLGAKAAALLQKFIDQLLVSGAFNNVLNFVARHVTSAAADRDSGPKGLLGAVDPAELAAYFLTTAWFFRYKRERAKHMSEQRRVPAPEEDGTDYGSVGAALSEVNFILLISYFRSSFEAKDWDSLHVAMVCLREMLLIATGIFSEQRTQREIELVTAADINEDRELAEGIIRKLFAQKQFMDMCVTIPKTAAKHSPEFLAVVVSVVHVLLKSFEALAAEDVALFIQTRRRMRKIRPRAGLNREMDREHSHLIDRGSDEEDNEDEMRYITQERKLDLRNTEVRFFHPDTVATHIAYLSKYEDLGAEEIKRGLSFFHRLFVVRKDYSALFRLDFMLLLYKLQAFLPRSSSNRRHVDDFIVYFMKKFKSALSRFPTAIELLFPRLETPETRAYLSTGDLELVTSSKKKTSMRAGLRNSYFDEDAVQPRAAPLLQFIDQTKSLDDKIGVLVYHLLKKKNTSAFLKFLASELLRLSETVGTGETADKAASLQLNLGNRRLLVSDPHLRLLVETIGFGLPYLQNDETTLFSSATAESLLEAKDSLAKWTDLHTAGVGDREPFLDQIQRVLLTTSQLAFGREALESIRDGREIDLEKAQELEMDEMMQHTVIGLAKRREYDDNVSSNFYADDDFEEPPSDGEASGDEDRTTRRETSARKRRRRLVDSDEDDGDNGIVNDDIDNDNDDIDIDIDNDDNNEAGLSSLSEAEEQPKKRRRRDKQARKEQPKKNRRRNKEAVEMHVPELSTRSSEMVQDSDDDSDDERNSAFFEKEEKLRQLIASTGGISSRVQLELFKESWSTILNSGANGDQVNAALKVASGLFVGDEESGDEEERAGSVPVQDTPNTSDTLANAGMNAEPSVESDSDEEEEDADEDEEDEEEDEEDEEEDEEEREESDKDDNDDERSVTRKRRVVIEDEDDE